MVDELMRWYWTARLRITNTMISATTPSNTAARVVALSRSRAYHAMVTIETRTNMCSSLEGRRGLRAPAFVECTIHDAWCACHIVLSAKAEARLLHVRSRLQHLGTRLQYACNTLGICLQHACKDIPRCCKFVARCGTHVARYCKHVARGIARI